MIDVCRNHDQHFLQLSTIGAAVAVVQVKHVVVVISVAAVAREQEQNQFEKKLRVFTLSVIKTFRKTLCDVIERRTRVPKKVKKSSIRNLRPRKLILTNDGLRFFIPQLFCARTTKIEILFTIWTKFLNFYSFLVFKEALKTFLFHFLKKKIKRNIFFNT